MGANEPGLADMLEMLADGTRGAEIAADFPYVSEADAQAVLAYAAAAEGRPVLTRTIP